MEGKETVPDKYTYEGNFKINEWNGQGKVKWSSGSSYEGQFVNSQCHGMGTHCTVNGI